MDAKEAGKILQAHRRRKGLTQDQVVGRSSVPTPQYLSALENGRYDVRNSEHFKNLVQLYDLTPEQVREIDPNAIISFEDSSPLRLTSYAFSPITEVDAEINFYRIAEYQEIEGDIKIKDIKKLNDDDFEVRGTIGSKEIIIRSIYDVEKYLDGWYQNLSDTQPLDDRYDEDYIKLQPNLEKMIQEKQEKYVDLQMQHWKNYLNRIKFIDNNEPDVDGWFEIYQAMRRNNVRPM